MIRVALDRKVQASYTLLNSGSVRERNLVKESLSRTRAGGGIFPGSDGGRVESFPHARGRRDV